MIKTKFIQSMLFNLMLVVHKNNTFKAKVVTLPSAPRALSSSSSRGSLKLCFAVSFDAKLASDTT